MKSALRQLQSELPQKELKRFISNNFGRKRKTNSGTFCGVCCLVLLISDLNFLTTERWMSAEKQDQTSELCDLQGQEAR